MSMNRRCIVVDDHPAICFALRLILENLGWSVLAEVDNGQNAYKQIIKFEPEVVILDIDLPDLDGLTLLDRIIKYKLQTRFIVLSAVNSEHLAIRVYQNGGSAYIHKSESLEKLPMVLELVMSGYAYFSETVIKKSINKNSDCKTSLLHFLSERELSVFNMLIKGKTNKEIASTLSLSPKTVSTYKSRVYDKMGVDNLVDLIEVARREKAI